MARIAVIGAGIAGVAGARALADAGHQVRVFEKSRSPGGRMATRRTVHGSFDHGAQYFTVRDPGFQCTVQAWVAGGIAAPGCPASAVAVRLSGGTATTIAPVHPHRRKHAPE